MSTLQLQTYGMLKNKLGEQEAKLFISYLESEAEQNTKLETKQLATKEDLTATKLDMIKEINLVKLDMIKEINLVKSDMIKGIDLVKSEIASVKSELNKQIYVVGLVQFLAIVGSVIGILVFMLRK